MTIGKTRLLVLSMISVVACLTVAIIAISVSYQSAKENTYLRLQESVQSQARLIESIIEHEVEESLTHDVVLVALEIVKSAYMKYTGFGETGEFTLASLEENLIHFQIQQRVQLSEPSTPTAVDVEWAEPMRRALGGESGTILARDYRGKMVFAAYEPVLETNLGLVAKIDRAEIIGRFVPAAITALAIALLVASLSLIVFIKLGNPVVQQLRSQKRDLEVSVERQGRVARALRYREKQQTAVADLGLAVLRGLEVDQLLIRSVSVAAGLLGLDYAKVMELRPDKSELLLRAGVGWHDGLVGKAAVAAVGESQAAFTLSSESPVVVEDMSKERRFSVPQLLADHGVQSGISVVIGSTESPWGVLGVHAKSRRRFSEADVSFVQSLANLIHNAIKRSTRETEQRAMERQLQHAQKLESLGVMAGGIAHDFNNILTTILGNASIALQDLSPDEPARPSVDAIETAARQAAGLVKQMLAYSGKGQFVVKNLSINSLLEEMVHLLEASVSKNVILKYRLGNNLPPIRADASQISQILMNLIINASEAIGEKSGIIRVSTGVMECDSEYLKSVELGSKVGFNASLAEGLYNYILVSDDGCGMNSETIAKIFDPFFTTKFTGRGLGLAAMLGIVRAHRGAIKIYTEIGKGSAFKVLLPVSTDLADAEDAEAPETATQNLWRGSGVVLLVDDDESIITLGTKMLQRLGFTIISASDGVKAVSLYRERKDDIVCVLLDLTMPRMNGTEAFCEIVQIKGDAKVILSSGYDEQQVTQDLTGKGLAGFLHKPYTLKDLKTEMRRVLG